MSSLLSGILKTFETLNLDVRTERVVIPEALLFRSGAN